MARGLQVNGVDLNSVGFHFQVLSDIDILAGIEWQIITLMIVVIISSLQVRSKEVTFVDFGVRSYHPLSILNRGSHSGSQMSSPWNYRSATILPVLSS